MSRVRGLCMCFNVYHPPQLRTPRVLEAVGPGLSRLCRGRGPCTGRHRPRLQHGRMSSIVVLAVRAPTDTNNFRVLFTGICQNLQQRFTVICVFKMVLFGVFTF